MNAPDVISPAREILDRVRLQAAYCLPGALVALVLTLPLYRYRLLWHRGPEAIYFELRDGFAYLSDIPALIAILAWLATPFWRRIRLLPRWLTAALVALALLATLSVLWAPMPSTALYQASRLWLLLVLFLVIATTPEARGPLIWGLVFSGAAQAAIGMAQFLRQGSLGLSELGEITLRPGWSGASVITVSGLPTLRAYGLTQHPNLLGGFLVVATLAGVGLVLGRRGWRGALATGLTSLSLAGLLLSFSRSAWVGLGVASMAGLGFLFRKPARTAVRWSALRALLPVLAAVGLLFVGTQWKLLRPRLGLSVEGVEIRSFDERAGLEASAWTLIQEHPWLGVGYGNFSVALWLRQPEALAAYPIYQPVHKAPLLAAAELGIPGALLWLTLAAGPWIAMWVRRRTWPPPSGPAEVAISVAVSLAALTVISWFDFYPWQSQQGRLLAWILWALWAQSWSRQWS